MIYRYTAKVVAGLVLLLGALLCFGIVYANRDTRMHGGHDLRPLLVFGGLMLIAGLGLTIDGEWAKNVSSGLLAAAGVWSIGHGFIVLGFKRQFAITSFLGLGLCMPLALRLRKQGVGSGKANIDAD